MANPTSKRGRATSGRVLVVETEGEREAETEPKTEQERAADETIAEVTAANPKTAEAIIWRLDPDTGEEKWLSRVASSLISNEWLGRKFGGGKYRVQYRKPNATGQMVYGGQERYTIDATVRPEVSFDGGGGGTPGMPGSRNIDAIMEAGVMGLITQMQNNSTVQMEFVRNMISERTDRKSTDWVAVLTALSPIVAALVPVITSRPDVMEKAKEIAELATKNQGATGGLKDFIGAFREMAEIRDMLGGGGDTRSTGERLLEAAIPKFVELADRFAVNQAAHAPAPAPVAVRSPATQPKLPAGTPPQQPPPSTVPPSEPMWLKFVSNKIPQWVKLAQMDKNPALYAELEIDNLPPIFMGPLRAFLQRPDAIDLVLGASPQLKEYEAWTREFFDEISTLVLGDDETEGEDGTEDEGDAEDGAGDGADEQAGRESDASSSDAASGTVPARGSSDDERVDVATGSAPVRRSRARRKSE